MAPPLRAIVIPSNYTNSTPSESFPTTDKGNCTWHTIFSAPSTPSDSMCSGIAVLSPRTGHLCQHRHLQAEIYYIISGKGIVTIDGKEFEVEGGASVFIPGDAEHGIVNKGEEELKWFYVFPTGSFSDIIYRFSADETKKEGINIGAARSKL